MPSFAAVLTGAFDGGLIDANFFPVFLSNVRIDFD